MFLKTLIDVDIIETFPWEYIQELNLDNIRCLTESPEAMKSSKSDFIFTKFHPPTEFHEEQRLILIIQDWRSQIYRFRDQEDSIRFWIVGGNRSSSG
jgi:hypothetical protein